MVDPASVQATITQLLAPDPTIGSSDTSATGVGIDAVGIEGSLTDPVTDPADSSPGTTYFVDNTPTDGDCPPTIYTTIQAGVNASGAGDTVKVCPGTYTEQVQISGHAHDGLKLESVKPLQAVIKWPTVELPPLALVDFKNADHVTLSGFTVTGPFTFPGCSPDRHEGLLVESAVDEHIHHNHITLIQNSLPALFGCQEGDAVAIGRRTLGTDTGSAHVDHNQIDEYQKNGVQAVNNGTSLHADHNVITGSANPAIHQIIASNGVVVFNQAAAVVDHNAISNNTYTKFPLSTGIILDQAPAGSSRVDHNRVFNNDFGIETDTQTNLEISHNDVLQNLSDAITLCGDASQGCGPATGIVVRANTVQSNGGSGVLLLGANANLLKSNQLQGNGTTPPSADSTDGIRVDVNSTNNKILNNQLRNNTTHDCHDDSAGSGTAGTGNTWQGNDGLTENKPGLCAQPECHEADGGGDFQGQQQGNFSSDNDSCKDGDQESVQSTNRGDGKDFQSTHIDSTKYDSNANTLTVSGTGVSGGLPVTFVFVALETGPTTPGWVSFIFSDGYANAGNLLNGSVLLH
jgi:parallel beta-helix repeat protein